MISYYNEFDPKAAAWLKQLIKNGNITNGEVDGRSITEVKADDLMGFNRCHFFAGIGTWDYCLSEAGWGDRQVWTASLPCQPFSVAGKGLGKEDERHLLPHFMELVRQCKPDTIFGEQVAAAIKHGWLDDLHANMEAEGYAIGHVVFGAHSIGAAHIRQRLYWVAHSVNDMCKREITGINGEAERSEIENGKDFIITRQSCGTDSNVLRLADSIDTGSERRISGRENAEREIVGGYLGRSGADSGVSNPESSRRSICHTEDFRAPDAQIYPSSNSSDSHIYGQGQDIDWLYCRDNKYRPIKSGIKPLVDGSASGVVYSGDPSQQINAGYSQEARAMRLKGYGNAIVAQCGIEFIKTFMDIEQWKTA